MRNPTLAELLERGARAPLARAGVLLLVGLYGLFDRADVLDRWYTRHDERGAHPAFALVRWDAVAADADRLDHVPMSPGERAVLLLAASLADGYRVDLASLLPLLDDQHAATLITAVYSTLRARDPLTYQWDELRHAGAADRDDAGEVSSWFRAGRAWSDTVDERNGR